MNENRLIIEKKYFLFEKSKNTNKNFSHKCKDRIGDLFQVFSRYFKEIIRSPLFQLIIDIHRSLYVEKLSQIHYILKILCKSSTGKIALTCLLQIKYVPKVSYRQIIIDTFHRSSLKNIFHRSFTERRHSSDLLQIKYYPQVCYRSNTFHGSSLKNTFHRSFTHRRASRGPL